MRQVFGLNSQKATGNKSLVSFGEMVSYLGEDLEGSDVVMFDDLWKSSSYFGVECGTN